MTISHSHRQAYAGAAEWACELVSSAPADAWSRAGLGEWDLRALVGHTTRALSTVRRALAQPAQTRELRSPQEYFRATAAAPAARAELVRDRGVAAGEELGADPAAVFRELTALTIAELGALPEDADPLVTSVAGGIRLSDYLPTRVFELVVHGLDICAALGSSCTPPPTALRLAVRLAADLAVAEDRGPAVLFALTGRAPLPAGFTVL